MEKFTDKENKSDSRRGIDRRKTQSGASETWDGVERRSKTDRRREERRARAELDPVYIAKMAKLQARREKEREMDEKRKKGREKKEVFRPK